MVTSWVVWIRLSISSDNSLQWLERKWNRSVNHVLAHYYHTVDGRNPAPIKNGINMDKPSINWCRISSIHRRFWFCGQKEISPVNIPAPHQNKLTCYPKQFESLCCVSFFHISHVQLHVVTNSSSHVIFTMTSCAHCHTIIHIQACNGAAQW